MGAPLIGADGQVHKTVTLMGAPGGRGCALILPPKRLHANDSNAWRRMGFPRWGFLLMEGRLRRGSPEGETKAGEEAVTVFA